MAILYFNGAIDTDWATLGNWWTNSSHTTQATSLPTSSDSVVIDSSVGSASASPTGYNVGTVVNLTKNADATMTDIWVIVTGVATIYGVLIYGGQITGNVVFESNSEGISSSTWTAAIIGNVTALGNATIDTNITGNATFNDQSYNAGIISGDCTFNRDSYNSGTVDSNATFNDNSYNQGTVYENATFNDSSFNDQSGSVIGDATFNDYSYNANNLNCVINVERPRSPNGSSLLGAI
jgi:hypothetical protein